MFPSEEERSRDTRLNSHESRSRCPIRYAHETPLSRGSVSANHGAPRLSLISGALEPSLEYPRHGEKVD